MAGEAGIEPRYVRQAAAELSTRRNRPLTGAPASLRLEHVVPGEVPLSAFDALVEEIRSATGMAGQAALLGRSVTWTSAVPGHQAPPRALAVTVAPVDGQTVIREDESLEQVASTHTGLGVMSALMGSFGGMAATAGAPSPGVIAAAAAWAGASLLGARHLDRRAAARHREDLADLLEHIAEQCEALIDRPPALPSGGDPPASP
ncbi:MAG TPA: hypothetical protein VHG93_21630 [Longimicrobium sp.]|nr:hypothetical protein [Longimicrobium sp.]